VAVKANTKHKVLEYLNKKGYSKSEAALRSESAVQEAEGRPIQPGMEDPSGAKYGTAFSEWNDLLMESSSNPTVSYRSVARVH